MTIDEVHVQLLGGFEVLSDGERVDSSRWPGRRAADLVQLLALADGHRMLREQVIDALWPQLGPEAGAANLRKAAHHARRALADPESVILHRGLVTLFPSRTVTTDVAAFESAAQLALAHQNTSAARDLADSLPGDLLPGSLYEEWTQAPRDRLQSLRADLLRLAGRWERLVDLDPTDEEACRAVMLDRLAAGRRHAAISTYGRLRTALRVGLGVAPSDETQKVYDECVHGMVAAESRFVGRDVPLSIITSRLRSPGTGAATLIAVRGAAGMGKSAFGRRSSAIAQKEGWRTLTVSAANSDGPYAALAAATERLVADEPGVLDGAGHRARDVLAELTPMVEAAGALTMPVSRHQVIGAVRRLLTAAAGPSGTLVVVDDAHLADAATIEALLHLGAVSSAPILTMLAYRPEAASETLRCGVARVARAGGAIEMDLAPLEPHEASALATQAGLVDRSYTVADLVAMAEGNPFFVLELARSAVSGGELRLGTSRHDAIAARFADLDDGSTAMLRRLALAGDDLDLPSVLAFTGCGEDEAFAMLDRAVSAGVLAVADGRYRFGHELVRQAMIAEIAPHHRVAIHRDAARRLDELGGPPAVIARHWIAGGRPTEAVPWLLAAARRSVELAAYRDALNYLDPLLDHDPVHVDGLLLQAESLEALGEGAALAAYADAARAAGEEAAQEIVPRQALAQIKQGDPAGALRTLGDSRPVTVEGRLAEALTLSGAAALGFGDPALGAAKAAESRRLALDSGDSASLIIASWANAAAAHARGELRGSVRIDLDDTHDLPHLAVNVFDGQLCITQRLLYGARPYDDVISFADSLRSEAERLGAARGHAFARTLGGEAKLLAGRLDEADLDLAAGEHLHRAIAASAGESFSLQRRAEVAIHRGRFVDARVMLDDALALAQESEVGFHLFDRIYGARIVAAETAEAGFAALEAAEEAVLGPAETCPGCRITLAVPAAIAAARTGDLERAAAYEKSAVFLAEVVMRLPAWYAALHEVRGHIASAQAERAPSRVYFSRAAEIYQQAEQPLDAVRCRDLAADVR
ncbi:MAG: AAA family ATPase [Aeromicrobium sp.]